MLAKKYRFSFQVIKLSTLWQNSNPFKGSGPYSGVTRNHETGTSINEGQSSSGYSDLLEADQSRISKQFQFNPLMIAPSLFYQQSD
jgi:hypothetical protein